jgi:AcrR family transcriptional regulator
MGGRAWHRIDIMTFHAMIVSVSDDERLEKILNAAYACFTRHGVRRTTMDDIARQAGMSRPAVYQYVRNKEDAFRRLTVRLLDTALTEAGIAIRAPGDLAGQLTGALEAKLRLLAGVWRDSPAHAAELLGVDARLSAELIDTFDAAMRDLLGTAIATGRPGVDDAGEIAELLMAFTRGLEADLSDPDVAARRLRHGATLIVAGLDRPHTTTKDLP